jgi:hypothetical protein
MAIFAKQMGHAWSNDKKVFELLSHLDPPLPGFSMTNWKSNIGSYVDAHPEYIGLSSWRVSERADFVYTNESGALASMLASRGCLDRFDVDRLRRTRPTYYLEVKSTPYPYTTSFFMNGHQYRRVSFPPFCPNEPCFTLWLS